MSIADRWTASIGRFAPLRGARLAALRLVRAIDRTTASRGRWSIAALTVLALQSALILTHQPWRDEWQALQLVQQSPDWAFLAEALRYEGHPPLWYAILQGTASLVGHQHALAVSALLCAIPAQLAILFLSPFRRGERLLLALSTFFLFEFFTLSRSLTLGAALCVLALAAWRSRWSWIAIALLPMADFLFGVLSGVLVLKRAAEKRLWAPGIALWLAVSGAAAWSVRPIAGEMSANPLRGFAAETAAFLEHLGVLLLPLQWDRGLAWDAPLPLLLAPFAWIGFLLFAWARTGKSRLDRVLLFGFIALCWLFSCFVYGLSNRHIMIVALLLVALSWIDALRHRQPRSGFNLWLTGAGAIGLLMSATAFIRPFETDREAAHAIVSRGLQGEHWMSFTPEHAQGISAQTGIAFERAETHCMQGFIRWNHRSTASTSSEITAMLRAELNAHGQFYLVSSRELPLRGDLAEPLFHVRGGLNRQAYWLYRIGPDAPKRPVSLPFCSSGQAPPLPFAALPG